MTVRGLIRKFLRIQFFLFTSLRAKNQTSLNNTNALIHRERLGTQKRRKQGDFQIFLRVMFLIFLRKFDS